MKNIKLVVWAIVIIFAISICSIVTFAHPHEQITDDRVTSEEPTIAVEWKNVAPGSKFEIKINLINNPGIVGMTLRIEYASELQLIDIKKGDALHKHTFTPPNNLYSGVSLVWDAEKIDDKDINDGTLATLTFKFNEVTNVDDISLVKISYAPGAIIGNDLAPIDPIVMNGGIEVVDFSCDINNDGDINSTDIVYMRRYIAGGYGITIDENTADVNSDGKVNTTDIVFMRRYIAGGYDIQVKPTHSHFPGNSVVENVIESTCKSSGRYDEVIYCKLCFKELVRETKVTSVSDKHSPLDAVRENEIPATCKNSGSYHEVTYCSLCNMELLRELKQIEKTNSHIPSGFVRENEVLPTCSTSGSFEEVSYCTVCDKELSRTLNTINIVDHLYENRKCVYCQIDKVSYGLEFLSNGDGTCIVSGIGTCSDSEIVIPEYSPDGDLVVGIGDYAFQEIKKIVSVVIPEGVTSIGLGAFSKCRDLENVEFSGNITSIGSDAFSNTAITYNGYDNAYYLGTSENPYFALIKAINREIYSCKVNENTVIFADSSFQFCTNLTSIKIPDTVTHVGDMAFDRCTYLSNVTLPKNLTIITEFMFNECEYLTSVTIPNNVKTIEFCAFSGCTRLKNIQLPEGLENIGAGAFNNCSKLAKMDIPDGVTNIGGGAFSGCASLTTVTLPSGITALTGNVFETCEAITDVYFNGTIEQWLNITFDGYSNPLRSSYYGGNLYINGTLLTELIVPHTISKINDFAFAGCNHITSITIENGVSSIGDYAFEGCHALTTLRLPASIMHIGREAFPYHYPTGYKVENVYYEGTLEQWCNIIFGDGIMGSDSNPIDGPNDFINGKPIMGELIIPYGVTAINDYAFSGFSTITSVVIPDGVLTIGNNAFANCVNLNSVVISNSVISIGDNTFSNCENLTDIEIGSNITSIGEAVFANCINLKNIVVDDNNTVYKSIDGNLYTKDGKVLLQYCAGKEETNFTVPETVTTIGESAFAKAKNLTSIIISEGVEIIEHGAFSYCIATINVPDSIKYIADFYESGSVTNHNGMLYIGNENNPYVVLGRVDDTSIEYYTLPENVKFVFDDAFLFCDNLVYTEFDNAYYIGSEDNPFAVLVKAKNTEITSCVIHPMTRFILSYAFDYCQNLRAIEIPDSVERIGSYAFRGCYNMKTAYIGTGVTSIGVCAFIYDLETIHYSGTIEEWNKIYKDVNWYDAAPLESLYIHCSNGDLYIPGRQVELQ